MNELEATDGIVNQLVWFGLNFNSDPIRSELVRLLADETKLSSTTLLLFLEDRRCLGILGGGCKMVVHFLSHQAATTILLKLTPLAPDSRLRRLGLNSNH